MAEQKLESNEADDGYWYLWTGSAQCDKRFALRSDEEGEDFEKVFVTA